MAVVGYYKYSSRNVLLVVMFVLFGLLCCLFYNQVMKTNVNQHSSYQVVLGENFGKQVKNQTSSIPHNLNPLAHKLLLDEVKKSGLTNEDINKHLHKDWFLSPSASPYNLLGRPSNTKYFSQDRQDQYVDQYFGKTNNGIFLEVGAADGVTLSNTLFLERERNWTGLLIEPDTSFYKRLTTVHRKAYTLNSCLSLGNKIGTAKFRQAGLIGGVEAGYTNTMKARAKKESPNGDLVEVVCIPVDLILTALEMYHIHFFSLDVEGAELHILRTIPFDKVQIDLFFIEYVVWNGVTDIPATEKRLKEFRDFFKNLGLYKEIHRTELDVVFARIS